MSLRTSLPVCDADSHLMEPPNWLDGYADPSIRDRLKPVGLVDSEVASKVTYLNQGGTLWTVKLPKQLASAD